jgi:PDZ domain/Secretion system C-terminal sorting domain
MKQASLLFAFCILFGLSAVAQTTTAVENTTKRITITTKKVDENGKTVTETYIAEGDDPAKILEGMAINPEMIQQVKVEGEPLKGDEERLFLIRSAGDNVTIEGTLNENPVKDENQKVVIVTKTTDYSAQNATGKAGHWYGGDDNHHAYAYASVNVGGERKSNCAALGVQANKTTEIKGARITKLIDKGPAQEVGLKVGDIITSIEGFEVTDFTSLFSAISNYLPGDRVTVRYIRDGKSLKVRADLKSWSEIPGYEYQARTDCGQPADDGKNQADIDDGISGTNDIHTLDLKDARIYPNPTDGVFSFSFNTTPGPLAVSITDVNGQVVYRDLNDNTTGTYQNDINIKDLPQGNYIITVNQGDKVFTQQISKQ